MPPDGMFTTLPLPSVMAVTSVPKGALSCPLAGSISVMILPDSVVPPVMVPALAFTTETSRLVYAPVASRLVL